MIVFDLSPDCPTIDSTLVIWIWKIRILSFWNVWIFVISLNLTILGDFSDFGRFFAIFAISVNLTFCVIFAILVNLVIFGISLNLTIFAISLNLTIFWDFSDFVDFLQFWWFLGFLWVWRFFVIVVNLAIFVILTIYLQVLEQNWRFVMQEKLVNSSDVSNVEKPNPSRFSHDCWHFWTRHTWRFHEPIWNSDFLCIFSRHTFRVRQKMILVLLHDLGYIGMLSGPHLHLEVRHDILQNHLQKVTNYYWFLRF